MPFVVATFFDNQGADAAPANQTDTSLLVPPAPVNVRFKTADDFNIDANDPIPIPAPGPPNFAFWKNLYMRITGGTGTLIRNVKFFTDTTGFGTGIVTRVGTNIPFPENSSLTQSGYEVATGVGAGHGVGISGDDMNFTNDPVNGNTGVTTTADAFSFSSGVPLVMEINQTNNSPATEMKAIGERTRYLVYQMEVDSSAAPGALVAETWTFQYEEI